MSIMGQAAGKQKCILLLGGSFSPIHNGHVALLVEVKKYLESKHGYEVIGAYLVLSTDRYVAGKLSIHGMKYETRKQICDIAIAAADQKWIHTSHIATANAGYYGEIITRQQEYQKFFNAENGNELSDKQLANLVRIECMGADKVADNPEMMQWLAKYTDANSKYFCIGRQGHTQKLTQYYQQCVKDGSIKADAFYFLEDEVPDISSTMIREYLLKVLQSHLNENAVPQEEASEEEKKDDDMDAAEDVVMTDKTADGKSESIALFMEKTKELLPQKVREYLIEHVQHLFFTEAEIEQCLSGKGRVVPSQK